jgi:transcriptional regulator with XRE-family HTH domain
MITAQQVKAARSLIGWNQEDLTRASGVSIATVKRMESRHGPLRGNADNVWKIQLALEDAGIVFLDENGGGPGVRLKQRSQS